jgi:hypothetical protein
MDTHLPEVAFEAEWAYGPKMKIIVTRYTNQVNEGAKRGTSDVRKILTASAGLLIIQKVAYWITMLLSIEFFPRPILDHPSAARRIPLKRKFSHPISAAARYTSCCVLPFDLLPYVVYCAPQTVH